MHRTVGVRGIRATEESRTVVSREVEEASWVMVEGSKIGSLGTGPGQLQMWQPLDEGNSSHLISSKCSRSSAIRKPSRYTTKGSRLRILAP